MRNHFVLLIILLIAGTRASAQYTNRTDYDLKVVFQGEVGKRCGNLEQRLKLFPPEVRFGTSIHGDSVFLILNSKQLFQQFFESKSDGFAIDLVSKGQYQCDNITRTSGSPIHKGWLLAPVYRDQIMRTMQFDDRGNARVPGGVIPKNLDRHSVEASYLLIEDKYVCSYRAVINVDSHAWDLLPMGMYYDTLADDDGGKEFRELEKTLRFTIPFARNAPDFAKADIKPLYDSLRLTDYAITGISIRAFTSVEGSLKRNTELQAQRARSIVNGLQSFQPETIKSEITANENWVEFLDDIRSTPFQYLEKMSKDEVKAALADPQLAEKIEPILKKHRKGIVELKLEKRLNFATASSAELTKFFNEAIAKDDRNGALYLQEVIFRRIVHGELPPSFLSQLEIPRTAAFGNLLVNQDAFLYEHGGISIEETLQSFGALQQLVPSHPKLEYNICVLRVLMWMKLRSANVGSDLFKRIQGLGKTGLHPTLVRRLQVNYQMIDADIKYWNGQFKEREPALKFLRDTYASVPASDNDLVSIANYLATNSRYPWAEAILRPRINALDASEDLLFFYAALTMYDKRNTASGAYRSFLLNLVNSDRQRFCSQFEPVSQGGISMQLLEDPFLKKTWCENCMCPECK